MKATVSKLKGQRLGARAREVLLHLRRRKGWHRPPDPATRSERVALVRASRQLEGLGLLQAQRDGKTFEFQITELGRAVASECRQELEGDLAIRWTDELLGRIDRRVARGGVR